MNSYWFSNISCTRESYAPGPFFRVFAPQSLASRAALDPSLQAYWEEGDAFSVFYGSQTLSQWKLKEDGGSCLLSPAGKLPAAEALSTIAVYPFRNGTKRVGGKVYTKLQEAVLMMAAATETKDLAFHHLMSVVRLRLLSAEDKSVDFVEFRPLGGEPAGGDVVIDTEDFSMKVTGGEEALRKRLSDKLLKAGEWRDILVPVPPGTYSKGYEMRIIFSDGTTAGVLHSMNVTLNAGEVTTLSHTFTSPLTLVLDFSTNPFKEALPSKASLTTADYTFSSSGRDYVFRISNTVGGYRWTGSALRLNDSVTEGDGGIRTPAIQGRSLTRVCVSVITSNSGKAVSVGPSPAAKDNAYVTAPAGVKTDLFINGEENTSYWVGGTAKNLQLSYLELEYE